MNRNNKNNSNYQNNQGGPLNNGSNADQKDDYIDLSDMKNVNRPASFHRPKIADKYANSVQFNNQDIEQQRYQQDQYNRIVEEQIRQQQAQQNQFQQRQQAQQEQYNQIIDQSEGLQSEYNQTIELTPQFDPQPAPPATQSEPKFDQIQMTEPVTFGQQPAPLFNQSQTAESVKPVTFGQQPLNSENNQNSEPAKPNQPEQFNQQPEQELYNQSMNQEYNQTPQQFPDNNQNQENIKVENESNGGFFNFFKRFKWLTLLAGLVIVYFVGSSIYNNQQLSAINPNNKELIKVTVKPGESINQISKTLADKKLVRNADVFSKYSQKQGSGNLQAGDFYLTKAQSVPQLFNQIKKGSNRDVYQKQFIADRAPYAQELQQEYGVLASINLAQTILESDWGESKLASKYNNYYGIKAQGKQKSVTLQTKEYLDDEWQTVNAKFAVYDDWKDGMLAHVEFLVNGTDLNPDQFADFNETDNYKDAARALVQDGYATDPDYAEKLIQTIKANDLQRFDK